MYGTASITSVTLCLHYKPDHRFVVTREWRVAWVRGDETGKGPTNLTVMTWPAVRLMPFIWAMKMAATAS